MTRILSVASLFAACALFAACPASVQKGGDSALLATKKTGCEGASLALAPETVVGSLNGTPVTIKDLGPELEKVETKALRDYCDAVDTTRRQAFDNYVTEKLVDAEAKAAGKATNDYVKDRVMASVGEPTAAEIQAFYDGKKSEGAPPLEMVKDQIINILKRQKSEAAIQTMVTELQGKAKLETKLPDVRSPAQDIDVTAHTAFKGDKGAKVKVIEFADFQCPYCSKAADTVSALKAKYGDKVEFAYRHFPLRSIHPNAQRAAEFAQCANAQGKFWEMHDKLYANQQKLDEPSMRGFLAELKIDAAAFDQCLSSGKGAADVEEDYKKGESLGIEGTPTFYINGRHFNGNPDVNGMSTAIDAELKG
jgi:protein-disulfide isomerase